MKILQKVALIVGIIVALPLVVAIFVSGDIGFEKAITINKPIDEVWPNVNNLKSLNAWSPWTRKDPNMKSTMTGTDGEVGATSSWDSEMEKVGKGSQTIAKVVAPTLFETDIKFLTPYESEAKGYIKLSEKGESTEVTWGFSSEIPYPFRIMKLFMNMEDAMDAEFSEGLNNLQEMCEG